MIATREQLRDDVRIIGVIATKDIVDSIRNKTIQGVLIGVLFLMLSVQALPLLMKMGDRQPVVVYDAGDSGLISALRRRDGLRVGSVRAADEVQKTAAEAASPTLGLKLPADLIATDGPVTLQGYMGHWATDEEVATAQRTLAEALSEETGRPVEITITPVYPAPDAGGRPTMVATGLIMVIFSISGILVPFLMMEERDTHTMEALLVSPASAGQVVAGKALAGLVYGLVAAAVLVAFSAALVVHWWVAVLAIVGGTLMAVALGLLLGTLFDNQGSLSMWLGAIFIVLLIPVLLAQFGAPRLPAAVLATMPYLPSMAIARLFQLSLAQRAPAGLLFQNLGLILAFTALLFALVIWRVRALDR